MRLSAISLWIVRCTVFTLCALYWFLVGLPAIWILPFSGAAFLFLHHLYTNFTEEKFDVGVGIGSGILSILFCAMLPITRVTDVDNLYRLVASVNTRVWLNRLANIVENALVVGLTFVLVLLFFYYSWMLIRRKSRKPILATASTTRPLVRLLIYMLPCLIIWSLFLFAYWPGYLTPDSRNQWVQAHTLILNDWHPVGDTLLIYLLTRLWDFPAVVPVFQVASMAIIWGLSMRFLESKGLPGRVLFIFSWLFALLPYNGILLSVLWKDIPYAIVNFLLVFLIAQIWYSRGKWLAPAGHQILFGFVLAGPYLLRHNGLFLLVLIPPVLFAAHARFWKPILTITILAVVITLTVRNGIAFGLLKAVHSPEAFTYSVPMQHIGAVIYYDGKMSPEQKSSAANILPLGVWKAAYNRYNADDLTKSWGAVQNQYILAIISKNKMDVIRLFLGLAIKNPGIVMRSELDLNSVQWEILDPPGKPRMNQGNLYPVGYPGILRSATTVLNRGSFLEDFLNQVLSFTARNPITAAVFWRGGLYLFSTLVFAVILFVERGWRSIVLFLPAFANVLSLAAAMTVQDFRYIYPYVLPVFFIALLSMLPKMPEC